MAPETSLTEGLGVNELRCCAVGRVNRKRKREREKIETQTKPLDGQTHIFDVREYTSQLRERERMRDRERVRESECI